MGDSFLSSNANPGVAFWTTTLGSGSGVETIQFDTSYTPVGHSEASIHWNDDDGCLEVDMKGGNVALQVGQETQLRAKNDAGGDIDNGEMVYINGGTGSQPTVDLAQAITGVSCDTIAMATEDVSNNQFGYFTAFGLVRDVNTNAWPAGTELFLSDTTPGGLTSTAPDPPGRKVHIGTVIRQSVNEGVIFVRVNHHRPITQTAQIEETRSPGVTSTRTFFPGTPSYVTGIEIWLDGVPATAGTFTLRIRKAGGNDLLNTAAYNLVGHAANARTALTLTGTAADITLAVTDVINCEFASNNGDLAGFESIWVIFRLET